MATRKPRRLSKLPLSELGIGLLTERGLADKGIQSVGDLLEQVAHRVLQEPANGVRRKGSRRSRMRPAPIPASLPLRQTIASFYDAKIAGDAKPPSVDLLLKLLQSEPRRELLCRLARGEQDVSTLADSCQMAPPHVSQSLSAFLRCGLLVRRRESKRVYYRLSHAVKCEVSNGDLHLEFAAARGDRLTLLLRGALNGQCRP